MYDLFTVVIPSDQGPHAVPPCDSNPRGSSEGMLVYDNKADATAAAAHQNEMYDLECVPMRLVDYISEIQGIET
jgi:hypothetical protein